MKKMYIKMVFFTFLGFLAFGHSGELKEIDFLLFAPNSSDSFADEEEARIQIDNLAEYFLDKNLVPGQIHIHGYAAAAKNDIDPIDLSMSRALFIKNELQKRGIPDNLFSSPIAHGEVNLWGSNLTEESQNPNRRVIVLLDDYYPISAALIPVEAVQESQLLWILIILLLFLLGIALLAAHFFLASKRKKALKDSIVKEQAADNPITAPKVEQRILVSALPPLLPPAAPPPITVTAVPDRHELSVLDKAIREIILGIPFGAFFDVHTVIEKLLQEYDYVYLTNVGNYTTAAHYHSRISSVIGHKIDLVEKAGNSYSKNIHDKFSECHLFRRKMQDSIT